MGVKREPLQKQEFAQKGDLPSFARRSQPDSFSIKHGRNSQLPRLVAAYTSHSTQHLFQVRDKSLENTCASTLPQSHLPPTTLLSCLSIFNSAQDTAFLLYSKDLKSCICYTSALLLWQAGDASRQQVQGWRVSLPLPQGRPHTGFPANPHPNSDGLETILLILNPQGKTK